MDKTLEALLTRALGKNFSKVTEVGADWMPANQTRPFIWEDPALIWLNYYGSAAGFYPDDPPYSMVSFLSTKKRQFRDKWLAELAPNAVTVCQGRYDIYHADALLETCQLMLKGVPVIALPTLWHAKERVFGRPDLLIHTAWLQSQLEKGTLALPEPYLLQELQAPALGLGSSGAPGHYVVVNLVFSTHLNETGKTDPKVYASQVRIQTFMLGQLQGYMPANAYLIARDAVAAPFPVAIQSTLNASLDPDLAAMRDQFSEIKQNGAKYRPWPDPIVKNNPKNDDERWARAKAAIALHPDGGGDLRLLPNIGTEQKAILTDGGCPDLKSLLEIDPEQLGTRLEAVKGIGAKRAAQLRAILVANRTQAPVRPPAEGIPPPKEFEFYVDFEFFSNLNVDCDREWPSLEGREMVFMIGVGWQENGAWQSPPKIFRAKEEDSEAEGKLFQQFLDFLEERTGGAYLDPERTALYHWSGAEITQSKGAADRHEFAADHPLRKLPWQDLRKVFLDGPAAVPGAWGFGLKEVAKALGHLDPQYDPQWIGDLDDGLGAMLLGWQLYTEEVALAEDKKLKGKQREVVRTHVREGWEVLQSYLEADCRALYEVLRWLRAGQAASRVVTGVPVYVGWDEIRKTFPTAPQQAYIGLNDGKGVVVYGQPILDKKAGKLPLNHLIWGDELAVLENAARWRKIRSRGTVGWVHESMIQPNPLLEVNFVDVGQGDGCFIVTPDRKYLLVDAGPGDNLYRFLRWYFAQFKAEVTFDAAIITHPDSDHYEGFGKLFDDDDPSLANVRVRRIYHNGIVDAETKAAFLKDGVAADRAALDAALQTKTGDFPDLLKKAIKSGRVTTEPDGICMLYAPRSGPGWLEGYEKATDPHSDRLQIQVLGPVPEDGAYPPRLRWYDDKGKTKNGNSIVLRLLYGNVSILLGGDLNVPSEEYLLAHYGNLGIAGGQVASGEQLIVNARRYLECDVAKACHHGSGEFTTDFLRAVNPAATVISSGDDESWCHPRPDTLGALGRFGRGDRPLIFSTELARSAPEQIKHPSELRRGLTAARLQERETAFAEDLVQSLGRSVAVYGMICLRTDGDKALFAQKLEKPASNARKWDLHLLDAGRAGAG